jgi:hypothetical protein
MILVPTDDIAVRMACVPRVIPIRRAIRKSLPARSLGELLIDMFPPAIKREFKRFVCTTKKTHMNAYRKHEINTKIELVFP